MTKSDWEHAITLLDDMEAISDSAKCSLCVYEDNCDENTDCIDGIARCMAKIDEGIE